MSGKWLTVCIQEPLELAYSQVQHPPCCRLAHTLPVQLLHDFNQPTSFWLTWMVAIFPSSEGNLLTLEKRAISTWGSPLLHIQLDRTSPLY